MEDSNFRVYYRPTYDPHTPVHMEFGPRGDYVSVKLGEKEFIAFVLVCRDVSQKIAPMMENRT